MKQKIQTCAEVTLPDSTEITVGSLVECCHSLKWQLEHRKSDDIKAKKLNKPYFLGNGAAYMHLDEAYVVIGISPKKGVTLAGFAPKVSLKDIRLSTKPVLRRGF